MVFIPHPPRLLTNLNPEPQPVPKVLHPVKQDDMQEMYMSSDEETMTTATFSTVAPGECQRRDLAGDSDMESREEIYRQFQQGMETATDNHVSTCKSTYFFDGGKRFISVSTAVRLILVRFLLRLLTQKTQKKFSLPLPTRSAPYSRQ